MGKGGASGNTQAGTALAGYINNLRAQSGPLKKLAFGQATEALKTGGVGAQIPLIQRAVENSRAATGNALASTTSQLSSSGLTGTPYGQSILAGTRTAGDLQTSQIGPSMAAQFASGVLPEAFNVSGNVISSLNQQSGQQLGAQEAAQSAQATEIGGGTAAAGAIAGAVAIALI